MKLLASDFDRTFFDENYLKNIKKANEFVDKGNVFVIITGRNYSHLLRDIKGYNIKYNYLICNDGGVIYDEFNNCIYRQDIDIDTAISIFNELKSNNYQPIIDTSHELVIKIKEPVNAIICNFIDEEKTQQLLNNFIKKYPKIYGYLSENWLNITHYKVSKGNTLKHLQSLLNLKDNDIYTVGDGINDISMNKMYNNSYAMDISIEELISVSNYKINTVYELIDIILKK